MNLQTTRQILRASKPCADGWAKLLKNLPTDNRYKTPILFSHILKVNGLYDTLWALRSVMPEQERERDREARLLACEYAQDVLYIFEAKYRDNYFPRMCLEVARKFALGQATEEDLLISNRVARGVEKAIAKVAPVNVVWSAAAAAAGACHLYASWAALEAYASAWAATSNDESTKQEAQFRARFCTHNERETTNNY